MCHGIRFLECPVRRVKIGHSRERGLQLQTSTLGPGGEGPRTRERGQEAGPLDVLGESSTHAL